MKPTLAMLVYAMVLGPAQVETLPASLPPTAGQTPGLKVPLPGPKAPAELAPPAREPQPPAELPPEVPLPLKVPLPPPVPRNPAGLAAPEDPPSPAEEPAAEDLPPVPSVPPPPVPYPGDRVVPLPIPAGCAACRQSSNVPPWERLRSRLRPTGPAAGYFVVQDVHGAWPVVTPDAPSPYAPPAETAPPPLVRASSHALPPSEAVMPVIYTARTEPPANPPGKMVIVQQAGPEKEIAWGAQDEYRKIVGQLMRVQVHGGRWVVRYAGLDKEDRYGGSVMLDPAADVGKCAEGDVVCVQGEVLNGGRAERPLGAPLYRVQSLQRLGGGKN